MRFAIMLEPQQGITYAEQLAVARRAEAAGFEAFFRSDHYESFPGPGDLPTTDAWTVLAGIARETSTIRLGALVSPVDLPVARPVRQDRHDRRRDERRDGSRSRSGPAGTSSSTPAWASPSRRRRAGRDARGDPGDPARAVDEPDGWSSDGPRWRVVLAALRPKPVQRPPTRHPRRRRWDASWPADRGALRRRVQHDQRHEPAVIAERYAALDEACRAIGRDPASIRRSAMIGRPGRPRRHGAGRAAAACS